MNVSEYMLQMGKRAREASRVLVHASTGLKNSALQHIAESIDAHRAEIQAENQRDVDAGKEKGLDSAMLDRLALNDARMDSMIEGLRQVAQLDDPNGELTDVRMMPSGIQVGKKRAPLGVVGIIYESRPNVTIDAASLCLKSGNATILRGGSEALHSNQAIAHCISAGLEKAGLPVDAVQVVATRDREAVGELITMSDYVDVVVPRGGKSLIERISRDAKVAVIKHLDGICHVYIDALADSGKAFDIAMNSKTHRYGVCNAMETLLVHADVAETVLPTLAEAYIEKGVELRGCQRTCGLLPAAVPAADEDWDTEYLAPILSVKIVDTFEQAVDHINQHGSAHTDAIVTENYTLAQRFLVEIDSASVIINASTRFADGFEYGLGAEIGISTDKIHVRGPVGLEGLTSQKWVVFGNGHIRR